jgi:hypothetical protein
MNRDSNQRLPQNARREWVQPMIRSISAGSAELNVNGANDGPNQVS